MILKDGEHKADLVTAIVGATDEDRSHGRGGQVGTLRLPNLWLLLGHVHRELDELSGRSAGPWRCRAMARCLATHSKRRRGLFEEAGHKIIELCERWYKEGDETALPRGIANFKAFENAMALDIAMGGSTNTVLHLLAIAHEGGVDFTMADMDRLSRRDSSSE